MNKFVNTLFKARKISNVRTFLSESYRCSEQWNNRLSSPILQKVRLDELTHNLDQKFLRKDVVSSIDIDVLANSIRDENYLNELRDLVHKFRLTKETGNMLESTNYATIRSFFEYGKIEDLIEMLDDRLNYGLFLDDYLGSMLLDHLLLQNNFALAAKVASLFMLQEDFGNDITKHLSLMACYKYISSLQTEEPTPKVEEPAKKKKEEEIKVRVRYVFQPFFDDHFDITDLKLLTGKTLCALTKNDNDVFSINCQLIGWLFYKKVDKLQSVSQNIIENGILLEETLKIVELALQQNHVREDLEFMPVCTKLFADLQKGSLAKEKINMENNITKKIQDSLNKYQDEHIHKHSRLFDEWENVRRNKFEEQVAKIAEAKQLLIEKEKQEKLRQIEEKLWYLENQEKVDMKIEENEKLLEDYLKEHPKKALENQDEYVPPEITKQRSS